MLKDLLREHPKARYVAGFTSSGKLVLVLRDFAWEPLVRQIFKL